MNRKEIKLKAKERLKENRWPMVLVCLIYSAVVGIIGGNSGVKYNIIEQNGQVIIENITNLSISGIMTLLTFLIAVPLGIGVIKFFWNNIYKNENVETIKDGFSINYLNNILTMFVSSLLIGVATLLFIIPGIILGLGLTLVPYILIQHPELGVVDTLKLSWEKMNGHKMEYFILNLSFIGWILLTIITLGIVGILFVFPYMYQTEAIFCDNILTQNNTTNRQTYSEFEK